MSSSRFLDISWIINFFLSTSFSSLPMTALSWKRYRHYSENGHAISVYHAYSVWILRDLNEVANDDIKNKGNSLNWQRIDQLLDKMSAIRILCLINQIRLLTWYGWMCITCESSSTWSCRLCSKSFSSSSPFKIETIDCREWVPFLCREIVGIEPAIFIRKKKSLILFCCRESVLRFSRESFFVLEKNAEAVFGTSNLSKDLVRYLEDEEESPR